MENLINSYKDLLVWQKAYELALMIYQMTEKFPKHEQYGLVSQLRRCAVSIVSNIAEGYQRQHTGEYVQFLSIAFGSCAELDTQLILSKDLRYSASEEFERSSSLLNEINKMLYSLMKKIKQGSRR